MAPAKPEVKHQPIDSAATAIKLDKKNRLRGFGVKFPNGTIHTRWIYQSKKSLKEEAPGELFGDTSTWARAEKEGYQIVKVKIKVKDA